MAETQSYSNHTRWQAPFHFFLMPGTLTLLVLCVINFVKHRDSLVDWILLLIGILAPVAVLLIRVNPLRAQDRLIRLEERLRLQSLLNDPLRARIGELTERQLVALRFASDAELSGLVEKALASGMSEKDIKKAIVTWRADLFRV